MPFSWGPRRGPAPVRARGPVFAVGQRVSVTCSGGQPTRVALTNDAGSKALGNLVDGTEVEIIAWRPNGFRGARYCVRATSGGVEGWLAVASLRGPGSTAAAARIGLDSVGDAIPAAARKTPVETGRRFGQR
jgi:hypothetical protein